VKSYFSFFIFVLLSVSALAQIDNRNKSIAIPAVESKKDSINADAAIPSKPIESKQTFNSLNTPKISNNLNFPKKEFSMFSQEEFGNPAELYVEQVKKNIADLRPTPEEIERLNGSTTDQFLGDFKSDANFVNVVYRDHGYTDGDVIQVLINDEVIHPRVFLTSGFKGFKLDLQPGFNKIDFLALNQGESGPNTAEFRVVDDQGNLVSANQWNLATGVKATIIINKE